MLYVIAVTVDSHLLLPFSKLTTLFLLGQSLCTFKSEWDLVRTGAMLLFIYLMHLDLLRSAQLQCSINIILVKSLAGITHSYPLNIS